MNKAEFTKMMDFLEESYNQTISETKRSVWFNLFEKISAKNFKKAIYECIKRYSRLPQSHDFYKVLDEIRALPHKPALRLVKPYVFYYDDLGRTYVLVSKTGICEDPPYQLKAKDGTTLYREFSPLEPHKAAERIRAEAKR